jgi:putative Holliday junction resolvase
MPISLHCMGRIMGIDYGMKRTGISVTDPAQIIVKGLDTQETIGVLAFIISYAVQEKLDEIVIGYPFVEGAWGDKRFKDKLDKFIADIRKAFPTIPVTLHDERNTSVNAREIMSRSGLKKSQREDKALLDRTSAILILQEYLGHI